MNNILAVNVWLGKKRQCRLSVPRCVPEQAGERVRGGTVAAAVGASTGPGQSASGLSLPGQKLLHRRQVSRTRRIQKLLLFPHCCYQTGGEKKKTGGAGRRRRGVACSKIPL